MIGLSHWRFRLKEWRDASKAGRRSGPTDDGMPVPSPYLINLVIGHPDRKMFLNGGASTARHIARLVDRQGPAFSDTARVLDFGVGCGRLIRHMPQLTSAELCGADYNGRLVRWCRNNLPGTFVRNQLKPPLPFPRNHFDVVWALSVFTHLGPHLQSVWLDELSRVIKPGGIAVLSFHDEDHPGLQQTGLTRDELREKRIHVHNAFSQGTNLVATFQSQTQVRESFGRRFEILEIESGPHRPTSHALAVLRLPGGAA